MKKLYLIDGFGGSPEINQLPGLVADLLFEKLY